MRTTGAPDATGEAGAGAGAEVPGAGVVGAGAGRDDVAGAGAAEVAGAGATGDDGAALGEHPPINRARVRRIAVTKIPWTGYFFINSSFTLVFMLS